MGSIRELYRCENQAQIYAKLTRVLALMVNLHITIFFPPFVSTSLELKVFRFHVPNFTSREVRIRS